MNAKDGLSVEKIKRALEDHANRVCDYSPIIAQCPICNEITPIKMAPTERCESCGASWRWSDYAEGPKWER